MKKDKENEIAIYEQIRTDVAVVDGTEYTVPMAAVFGKGTVAKQESFGNRTLLENTRLVDKAVANTQGLQNVWNRSHSQWDWKHLNLSYHSPLKNMRQIAAELNSKTAALNNSKWGQIELEVEIRKLEEELEKGGLEYWKEVEIKIKLAQKREGMAGGVLAIEGAMKDMLSLNEIYEQLKNKVSDFSEYDFEKEESKSHLKRSVVQCTRDVRQSGSITKGEQEYLEHIGVNPGKMQFLIRQYIQKEIEDSWSTHGLQVFVDEIVDELIDVQKVDIQRLEMMGFDPEPASEYSYDKKIALLTKQEEDEST
jgi:hypothetical protein|tara:strand:- start:2416 stop:3342 length:927 start_codon:yes stop_codon:yes gene_type:complete